MKLRIRQTRSAYVATRRSSRFGIETLEERRLLAVGAAAGAAWQNPDLRWDVNGDSIVTPLDALICINKINSTPGFPGPLPALGEGQTPDYFYDVNGDGNLSPSDVQQLFILINNAGGGPKVQLSLATDTGYDDATRQDLVTNNLGVNGTITVAQNIKLSNLVSLTVTVDGKTSANLLGSLVPDDGDPDHVGKIAITTQMLRDIDGGLPDGLHTIVLTASDQFGFTNKKTVKATLDTSALVPAAPALAAESDSGASNSDGITKVATPKFSLSAEPNSLVELFADGTKVGEVLTNAVGLATITTSTLTQSGVVIRASVTDSAGNVSPLSAAANFQLLLTAPAVTLGSGGLLDEGVPTIAPFITDVTPNLVVTGQDGGGEPLPNGTAFVVDVDLNNDGDFDDSGEQDNTSRTLWDGQQTFALATPLPRDDTQSQTFGFRARITDLAGNVGASATHLSTLDTKMRGPLQSYIDSRDKSATYTKIDEYPSPVGASLPFTVHILDMTSGTWRTAADFETFVRNGKTITAADQTIWKHNVVIVVPNQVTTKTALLYISGGSFDDKPPTRNDFASNQQLQIFGSVAAITQSIVVYLPDVPREPMVFANDNGDQRSEDDIIAYSYDKYLDLLKEDPTATNSDWPLLLPMTRAAVKTMDSVQDYIGQLQPSIKPDSFVVSGGSKRGWTTWLTAAVDDRVKAIIPQVYDNLNIGAEMLHHYSVYGFFAQDIAPYNRMDIFQRILTAEGQELGKAIDPYSYLNNGRFNIPILSMNSAGDQFFVSDSSQYYFSDLPSQQKYLMYIPNTGHGLDAQLGQNSKAVQGLLTFYSAILKNQALPKFSWQVQDDGSIKVTTQTTPTQVSLWQAHADDRDFRFPPIPGGQGPIWSRTTLSSQGSGVYVASVPKPDTGSTAFMIELLFPGNNGMPFRFTTQIVVSTRRPLVAWPFDVAGETPPAETAALLNKSSSLTADEEFAAGLAAISATSSLADGASDDETLLNDTLFAGASALLPKAATLALTETAGQPSAAAGTLAGTSAGSYTDQPSLDDLLFGDFTG